CMSIPAINVYSHGTHITVAHAMGTTIGINTMILLGSIAYLLNLDTSNNKKIRMNVLLGYWIAQISLMIFWLALIIAGIIKGYQMQVLHVTAFSQVMEPVLRALKIFLYAGISVAFGLFLIIYSLLQSLRNQLFDGVA
ncbi:MAG: cbb3-type cytochrome c oxidase subunit I, partial [Ferruginibacter sp.]